MKKLIDVPIGTTFYFDNNLYLRVEDGLNKIGCKFPSVDLLKNRIALFYCASTEVRVVSSKVVVTEDLEDLEDI